MFKTTLDVDINLTWYSFARVAITEHHRLGREQRKRGHVERQPPSWAWESEQETDQLGAGLRAAHSPLRPAL